jgi:hypothetical protein
VNEGPNEAHVRIERLAVNVGGGEEHGADVVLAGLGELGIDLRRVWRSAKAGEDKGVRGAFATLEKVVELGERG